MEEEIKHLYEAVIKLNEKMSQVNSKNEQLEVLINSISQYILENKGEDIMEQETVVLDPFNLGGYKNISSQNGSVFKVKSKALCVNGRHTVENAEPVLICSKCNSIICHQHDKGVFPPICINCISKEIEDLDPLDIYVLHSVSADISLGALRKILKGSYKEFARSQGKLIRDRYIERDLLFRRTLTVKGSGALAMGSKLYDLSFLQNDGS